LTRNALDSISCFNIKLFGQVTKLMKRLLNINFPATLFLLLVFSTYPVAFAQQTSTAGTASQATLPPAEISRIIREFTAKETNFRRALNSYGFKRDAVIQTIGMGGQVTGEYHRVSNFAFDDQGNRYEKIVFFPLATMANVTEEDIEDLGGINPFALEASKTDLYNFTYVGKERIDELSLYVFDVTPKVIPDPKKIKERVFQGRIWVDDQDLQIEKSKGKGLPETKNNKYPVVETYREQIDAKYWFPTYSFADEELVFGSGEVLHVRMRVRYTDFHPGSGKATITEIDPDTPDPAPRPTPTPAPVKPKP
jgi:hypothetical protein